MRWWWEGNIIGGFMWSQEEDHRGKTYVILTPLKPMVSNCHIF